MMDYPKTMVVELSVSDPWEWSIEVESDPLIAMVEDWQTDDDGEVVAVLIRLQTPQMFKGTRCEYFIAQTRYIGQSLAAIPAGDSVSCCLIWISEDKASSETPFDLTSWRAGIALIATVRSRKA